MKDTKEMEARRHWIRYVSGKIPNNLPGPGGDLTAAYLLSTDDAEAERLADQLETGYVIVDQAMLTRTYYALLQYSGLSADPPSKSETLASRLYEKKAVQGYRLIYEDTTVKIYRRN